MKKLIFLHGSGSDKNFCNSLMHKIADFCCADLITFNAPFEHPEKINKYRWFNKIAVDGRRDAVVEEYMYSLQYIKNKINELCLDTKDVILIGHSQGGGMAVHIGLELELSTVVSINGDLPYNISYKKNTKTPVYWLAGEKDTYIDDNRKKSYKLIQENNNFHFLMLKNSTHKDFENDLLELINEKIIKF